jgi:hypothetical protein
MKMKMDAKDNSDHTNPIGWRAMTGGLIVAILGGLLVALIAEFVLPALPSLLLSSPNAGILPVQEEFPGAETVGTDLFENTGSIRVKYGCIMLLGLTEDDQLEICNGAYNLPPEWVNKVQRIAPVCQSTSADVIMAFLRTEEDLTGESWDFAYNC